MEDEKEKLLWLSQKMDELTTACIQTNVRNGQLYANLRAIGVTKDELSENLLFGGVLDSLARRFYRKSEKARHLIGEILLQEWLDSHGYKKQGACSAPKCDRPATDFAHVLSADSPREENKVRVHVCNECAANIKRDLPELQ